MTVRLLEELSRLGEWGRGQGGRGCEAAGRDGALAVADVAGTDIAEVLSRPLEGDVSP